MLRPRALLVIMLAMNTSIASANSTEIFSKTLPDGTSIDIVQTVQRQQRTPTKEDQEKLPDGFVAVGGEFEVLHYAAKYSNSHGETVSIWEMTVESLVVPAGKGFSDKLTIHDVAMDPERTRAAVLYIQSNVLRVDVVHYDEKEGKFQLANSQTIFDLASRGNVLRAEMIQHTDLYVFTLTSLEGSEIWHSGESRIERVYKRD